MKETPIISLFCAINIFNFIQDGFFRGCSWVGVAKRSPFPKICHTYPTKMKLGTFIPYLKKFQEIYESRDTPLAFCWHQHFFNRNQQILLYQGIQISFWYIISISFNFPWVFKDCFRKHGNNFDDVSKNDLRKIKVFWKKVMTS